MKLNILYLLLAFVSCLSVIVCNNQDDLNICKRVCDEDLLPRMEAMARNDSRSISDFEDILPYWTTCQYRCHRCYLPGGIRTIERIKTRFDNDLHVGMLGFLNFMSDKDAMIHSLKWSCYTLWQNAINDDDYDSKFS
ncbi:hypothetical protein EDC94DRAFT_657888 [Helicostylum pulchrum]|nr:hypothetical protein EDC94DRAFT_657888 [Helicostylum pulchrum]